MNFLERLDILKASRKETNADLSRNADIPYSTIDGLYKKGYENVKLSTIVKISDHYGVSLDYLAKGIDGLSNDAQLLAARFDNLTDESKALVRMVIDFESKRAASNREVECVVMTLAEQEPYYKDQSNSMLNSSSLSKHK